LRDREKKANHIKREKEREKERQKEKEKEKKPKDSEKDGKKEEYKAKSSIGLCKKKYENKIENKCKRGRNRKISRQLPRACACELLREIERVSEKYRYGFISFQNVNVVVGPWFHVIVCPWFRNFSFNWPHILHDWWLFKVVLVVLICGSLN